MKARAIACSWWSARRGPRRGGPGRRAPTSGSRAPLGLRTAGARVSAVDCRRESLTPELLARYSQEQVDQIYGRLTAGPIPDGPYDGDLFFPRGTDSETRLGEIIGGHLKPASPISACARPKGLGRMLWKGKVFYRDERLLRNRIEDLAIWRRSPVAIRKASRRCP